ncbi:hypothetical protein BJY00DRAFT_141142 [Aspergillus carlsbadensis]|nr:hypothetical protein BJY00DRAFT_141142 [Aspergillus carlsbadensis]
MAMSFEPIGLTPLDHATAKLYVPYVLIFNTTDSQTAVQTLQNGINKLVAQVPWLAGDIVTHTHPVLRGFIHPPRVPVNEVQMLSVRHFDRDEDCWENLPSEYLPLPGFVPAAKQRAVLRLQANISPSKIVITFQWLHLVFDGSGAGTLLEALAECCRAAMDELVDTPITRTVAATAIAQRQEVSTWASKGKTRDCHDIEFGPPLFDCNISSEQWAAMESAMRCATSTYKVTICPTKLATLKATCTKLLPQLPEACESSFFSSGDIIAAVVSIAMDRIMYAEPADPENPRRALIAVDLRRRINPPLLDTYLGNMIHAARSRIDCGQARDMQNQDSDTDLLHAAQLALQIRTQISLHMNEQTAYSCCARVAHNRNWYATERKSATVLFSSWRHLKCYALDFGPGLGYIDDFQPGFALIPGVCIVLPQRVKQMDSTAPVPWEVTVTLPVGQDEALRKDPLLRQILECA